MTELDKSTQLIKELTMRVSTALKRVKKAKEQFELWGREMKEAELALELSTKEATNILKQWNPETNEIESPLEEMVK